MRSRSIRLAVALAAVTTIALQAATSRTRAHVQALASPSLDGRLTGTAGESLAADYIVSALKKMGAKPLPGVSDFRLPFDFTAGTRDGGSTLTVNAQTTDARALSFSDNGNVGSSPVVFAGYGIVVPATQDLGYDSYTGLDVKDKVVLVLRYFPEDADAKTKQVLARYSDLRYKAMQARQHGAKAMVVVTGPRSPNAGELVPMTFDTALAGSGIVAVSIKGPVADVMFARAGRTLEAAQQALDSGNPHVAGFDIPDTTVAVHADVRREKRNGRNVVAYLPATVKDPGPKRWVALGAHYDHLGRGEAGNTLAAKDEAGKPHPGADDNASGSAAVLAIGEALSQQPRRRHVLLAFWSGEELGLLGSSAFAATPPVPMDQLAAYINFDMVGRMQDNKLTIQGLGTSPAWPRTIEQANVAAGFDLQLSSDPYQPTDVATFNLAGVPCITFFTGIHPDYHRPGDTADKINYDDLDRVVEFAASVARRIADREAPPSFTKVEQTMQQGGRAGVRVFTGTIPDYSTEVKGLLLSGVIGGGPADQAGLRKGDIIVEIAGQTIANIYDYTYALDVLKIGQPANVVYTRNGERHETTLTPAARR